jgi:pyridoxal phosphate enzyme (YggS family)
VELTIHNRIEIVQSKIKTICERVGRNSKEITFIAVTKGHGIEKVIEALNNHITDLGENKSQELVLKQKQLAHRPTQPIWHFLGHLQSNKVKKTVNKIDTLHSLDSIALINSINKHRLEAKKKNEINSDLPPLKCYIEVNIANEPQKSGIHKNELERLLSHAENSSEISVEGLMTIAPYYAEIERTRPIFQELREIANNFALKELSMGMSRDFEIAIEEGATTIRLGTTLFGERAR